MKYGCFCSASHAAMGVNFSAGAGGCRIMCESPNSVLLINKCFSVAHWFSAYFAHRNFAEPGEYICIMINQPKISLAKRSLNLYLFSHTKGNNRLNYCGVAALKPIIIDYIPIDDNCSKKQRTGNRNVSILFFL